MPLSIRISPKGDRGRGLKGPREGPPGIRVNPGPKPMEEGDYTSYSLIWSTMLTRYGTLWAIVIDREGGVIYLVIGGLGHLMRYALSNGSETEVASDYNTGWLSDYDQFTSFRKRYVVLNRADQIEVWKDGSLLQSIPMSSGYSLSGWAMSWNAEYIAFIEYMDTNYYLRCYKGS